MLLSGPILNPFFTSYFFFFYYRHQQSSLTLLIIQNKNLIGLQKSSPLVLFLRPSMRMALADASCWCLCEDGWVNVRVGLGFHAELFGHKTYNIVSEKMNTFSNSFQNKTLTLGIIKNPPPPPSPRIKFRMIQWDEMGLENKNTVQVRVFLFPHLPVQRLLFLGSGPLTLAWYWGLRSGLRASAWCQ